MLRAFALEQTACYDAKRHDFGVFPRQCLRYSQDLAEKQGSALGLTNSPSRYPEFAALGRNGRGARLRGDMMMPKVFGRTGSSAALTAAGHVSIMAAAAGIAILLSAPAVAADCRSMPEPGIDWRECNKSTLLLSESALDGANLMDANLTATDLRHSSLVGANLEKATLIRASLAGSRLDKANLSRIEGYRTVFSQISAAGASFASAELERAEFSGANLTGADFDKAELGRANFVGATITGARFTEANLARADFTTAKFEGPIDFSGAFLLLTRFDGLDLSQAAGLQQWQIDQACGDQKTKLPSGLKAPADWPCPHD